MERDIYSVSRLNREVRTVLEGSFPLLWLEAEISNFTCPASGHWYFSLKDEAAQVRGAMFRNRNRLLRFKPENGMQVLVRAHIGLYEPRGEFQILIEHMEEAGDGALRRAFEELKQRLDREGLFSTAHKKPLPEHPRCVGVITSATGAAIRDILTTLQRRFPALPVIVYPVAVQGACAAAEISEMIQLAAKRQECDVLILARGGGSLEDLWSFNEEIVARAIYACPLPIITGIGHEIDFTIADFVADHRAPTPTAAAELVSPDQQNWLRQFQQYQNRLITLMCHRIRTSQQQLEWLSRRLPHPARSLQEMAQRLDELEQRLQLALRHHIKHTQSKCELLHNSLHQHNPIHRLERLKQKQDELRYRLYQGMHQRLEKKRLQLLYVSHNLNAVSPLATLNRGYAIVTTVPEQKLIQSSLQVKAGQRIQTRLAEGRIISRVESTD